MTVTPDRTARAARAGRALMSRHAELQEVLDQWAGVLAAAADSGGRSVRRGTCCAPSLTTRCWSPAATAAQAAAISALAGLRGCCLCRGNIYK